MTMPKSPSACSQHVDVLKPIFREARLGSLAMLDRHEPTDLRRSVFMDQVVRA
jgi:hypothetical protein